jgi:uncharacterized membrane protein affecting hemolysin expression
LKSFALATSNGLILDFEIYQEKTTILSDTGAALDLSSVLCLTETLPMNYHPFVVVITSSRFSL